MGIEDTNKWSQQNTGVAISQANSIGSQIFIREPQEAECAKGQTEITQMVPNLAIAAVGAKDYSMTLDVCDRETSVPAVQYVGEHITQTDRDQANIAKQGDATDLNNTSNPFSAISMSPREKKDSPQPSISGVDGTSAVDIDETHKSSKDDSGIAFDRAIEECMAISNKNEMVLHESQTSECSMKDIEPLLIQQGEADTFSSPIKKTTDEIQNEDDEEIKQMTPEVAIAHVLVKDTSMTLDIGNEDTSLPAVQYVGEHITQTDRDQANIAKQGDPIYFNNTSNPFSIILMSPQEKKDSPQPSISGVDGSSAIDVGETHKSSMDDRGIAFDRATEECMAISNKNEMVLHESQTSECSMKDIEPMIIQQGEEDAFPSPMIKITHEIQNEDDEEITQMTPEVAIARVLVKDTSMTLDIGNEETSLPAVQYVGEHITQTDRDQANIAKQGDPIYFNNTSNPFSIILMSPQEKKDSPQPSISGVDGSSAIDVDETHKSSMDDRGIAFDRATEECMAISNKNEMVLHESQTSECSMKDIEPMIIQQGEEDAFPSPMIKITHEIQNEDDEEITQMTPEVAIARVLVKDTSMTLDIGNEETSLPAVQYVGEHITQTDRDQANIAKQGDPIYFNNTSNPFSIILMSPQEKKDSPQPSISGVDGTSAIDIDETHKSSKHDRGIAFDRATEECMAISNKNEMVLHESQTSECSMKDIEPMLIQQGEADTFSSPIKKITHEIQNEDDEEITQMTPEVAIAHVLVKDTSMTLDIGNEETSLPAVQYVGEHITQTDRDQANIAKQGDPIYFNNTSNPFSIILMSPQEKKDSPQPSISGVDGSSAIDVGETHKSSMDDRGIAFDRATEECMAIPNKNEMVLHESQTSECSMKDIEPMIIQQGEEDAFPSPMIKITHEIQNEDDEEITQMTPEVAIAHVLVKDTSMTLGIGNEETSLPAVQYVGEHITQTDPVQANTAKQGDPIYFNNTSNPFSIILMSPQEKKDSPQPSISGVDGSSAIDVDETHKSSMDDRGISFDRATEECMAISNKNEMVLHESQTSECSMKDIEPMIIQQGEENAFSSPMKKTTDEIQNEDDEEITQMTPEVAIAHVLVKDTSMTLDIGNEETSLPAVQYVGEHIKQTDPVQANTSKQGDPIYFNYASNPFSISSMSTQGSNDNPQPSTSGQNVPIVNKMKRSCSPKWSSGTIKRNPPRLNRGVTSCRTASRSVTKKPQTPENTEGWEWLGRPQKKMIHLSGGRRFVKRECYKAVKHEGGLIVRLGDYVLIRNSMKEEYRPYVAKIYEMWKRPRSGAMMVSVRWYDRRDVVDNGPLPDELKDEVFETRFQDDVEVSCIDEKCFVLTHEQYWNYRRYVVVRGEHKVAERTRNLHLEEHFKIPTVPVNRDLIFFIRVPESIH